MRVVIGEDEALLRHGLQLVLEGGGFEVVAAASDAVELERAVGLHLPELVITDIRMPPSHSDEGLRAALRLRAKHPEIAVVVLSQHMQSRYAKELLSSSNGKVGYLLKQRIADVDTFLGQLRDVAAGGMALDPDVVALMVARAKRSNGAIRELTPRQQEVLALMAEGRSNSRIAAELFLSEKAVVQHTSRIYDSLNLALDGESHRRVLAVMHYLSDN
ncbi:DNA-binding response regulator [Arthrobacter psychrolactophilus]|uniref:DNA-binding response regulator n=1 Tax=Arthrobacter psychrolactophilus TaxID=92442 RepID=A0A2V5IVF8_9MICC|nr:response regulator transcription factor [Arthrobacter psychrolactophilus]PYI38113.1 DNA-binding response regulator [Arthrobacter psychrolactophilus]